MEDKPSTSKKITDEDHRGRSESSLETPPSSNSPYSVQSRLEMAAAAPEMPKPSLGKPEAKTEEKKKRKKRGTSRVEKRKKPPTRRQVIRRAPRRKPRTRVEKKRDLSVSTIYTRLSSSGMLTPGCERCGHRCCRRRFELDLRRYINRVNTRKHYKRYRPKRKRLIYKTAACISESVQVGSRTKMLSPLFVNQDITPPPTEFDPSILYSAITPEMIYESLRNLTMWKQCVQMDSIINFMLRNYPVNPNQEALAMEVLEKLRIAAAAGIVCQLTPETWSLSCALQKRKISKTHVTLFWKLYGDTMRPIAKNQYANAATQNVNNMTQVFRFYDNEIV